LNVEHILSHDFSSHTEHEDVIDENKLISATSTNTDFEDIRVEHTLNNPVNMKMMNIS
jgi:hypothetical protein